MKSQVLGVGRKRWRVTNPLSEIDEFARRTIVDQEVLEREAVPVKQVGYSGLMVPVMEDKLLAQRWAESTYNIDSLLAYSAVCGTGLDTVPLPGDVSLDQMERIFEDVASLAVKWNKPLSARLQPVPGKKAGDRTDFQDPHLFNTTVHPLP